MKDCVAKFNSRLVLMYTANVNRQTADNLSFSYAVITGENV